MAEIYEVLNYY